MKLAFQLSLKFPKNEFTVHNNTWWTFLKKSDQMNSASFRSLSLRGTPIKNNFAPTHP
jgi:hypothetical protein